MEIEPDCSAVAFAERMQGVEFNGQPCKFIRKLFPGEFLEVVLGLEIAEDAAGFWNNKIRHAERNAAVGLGYIDCTDLTGKVIKFSEKAAV